MKFVKASEIGTYVYCQRAWWYQVHGYRPENQADLARGKDDHAQHSNVVASINILQALAMALLLGAVTLAILWYLQAR